MYKLRIPDEIAALIRSLHPLLKRKIRASLQIIVSDPHAGKALKDELIGLSSFRVGRLRIIYRISDKKEIEIIAVGPRDRIYEETLRVIKKPS
jgi:mRNA interferase RelE/StbE